MPSIETIKSLAKGAQTLQLVLAAFFGSCLAFAGWVLLYYDVSASYYGWGKLTHTAIDIEAGAIVLAIAVSALPSVVQLVFVSFKTAGIDFVTDNALFLIVVGLTFLIDTALDTVRFYKGTGASLAWGFTIAFFFFGICSEFCISYFSPISVALWGEVLKRTEFGVVPVSPRGQQQRQRQRQPQKQTQANGSPGRQTPRGQQPGRGRK